jgi:hypothetical protein
MDRDTVAHESSKSKEVDLAEDYRQMAADREREAEAEEWTEAFIADVASDEGYGLLPVH